MVDPGDYNPSIVHYRKWLEKENRDICERYLRRLDSKDEGNVEGAIGEAVGWDWLASRVAKIELEEQESDGGADFRCTSHRGESFIVEVTTLTNDLVTRKTGLNEQPQEGAQHYGLLTGAIKNKVISKALQLAGYDVPVLVFVIVLHFEASAVALNTHHLEQLFLGTTGVSFPINAPVNADAKQIAYLDNSLFFRTKTTKPLRQHISGVLVGAFGLMPVNCRAWGVLHPFPIRPFNPANLPEDCFGRLIFDENGKGGRVDWRRTDGLDCSEEAERERRSAEARARLIAGGYGDLLVDHD